MCCSNFLADYGSQSVCSPHHPGFTHSLIRICKLGDLQSSVLVRISLVNYFALPNRGRWNLPYQSGNLYRSEIRNRCRAVWKLPAARYGKRARPVEFPGGNPIQRGELEHFHEEGYRRHPAAPRPGSARRSLCDHWKTKVVNIVSSAT